MGPIVLILMGWTLFLPKLGRILDLVEKGVYTIMINTFFLGYLGFKALFSGDVDLTK